MRRYGRLALAAGLLWWAPIFGDVIYPDVVSQGGGVQSDGTYSLYDSVGGIGGVMTLSGVDITENGYIPQTIEDPCLDCETIADAVYASLCSGPPPATLAALQDLLADLLIAQVGDDEVCDGVPACLEATLAALGL